MTDQNKDKSYLVRDKLIFSSLLRDLVHHQSSSTPILGTMNISKQLNILIADNNLSVAKTAKLASIPKQTLHNWTLGQSPRKIEDVKKVADVLGVSLDYLCFGDVEKVPPEAPALDALVDGEWISGVFEVKIRKVKK